MAYIQKWNPLDDQTETTGQTTGINPVITQGSQSADTGGTDPNAQKQDGNFHNLQKYLAANQPGATALGGQIAGDINQAGANAQTAMTNATNDFTSAVNAGTNIFNPEADPSTTQQSTYTGPTNFNNSEQGIAAMDAVNKANEKAMLGSTVGGRTQMLQETSPQDMTRGGANLDQFLLQNTMPAYNQVATAANNMAPLTGQFNTQSTTNQTQVTNAQKSVTDKNAALQGLVDKQTTDIAAAKTAADKAAAQTEVDATAATQKAANDAYLAQLAAANNTQQTQFEQQQATTNATNETAYQKMVDLINSYKASTTPTTTSGQTPTTTPPPSTTPNAVKLADGRMYDPATGIISGSVTSNSNTGDSSSTGTNSGTQGEGGMGPGSSVSSGSPTGVSVGAPAVGLTGSQIANIALSVVAPSPVNIGKTIAAIVSNVNANNAVAQAVADSNPATNGSISDAPTAVSAADSANGVAGVTGGQAAAAGAAAAAEAAAQGLSPAAIGAAAQAAADAAISGNTISAAPTSTSDNVGLSASSGNTGDNASASVSASPGDAPGDSPGSVSVGASEGQSGSVSEGGGGGGGGKVICTAINDLYGLPYTENKVWIKYAVTHLKPEHQVGYHKVFLPLVDYGFKQGNGWSHLQVRKMLTYIAVHRTIDIQAELMGKYRRPVHKLLRNIIEPVLYWIGKRK